MRESEDGRVAKLDHYKQLILKGKKCSVMAKCIKYKVIVCLLQIFKGSRVRMYQQGISSYSCQYI